MVSHEEKIKNFQKEFDETVKAYNKWLRSQSRQTIKLVPEYRHPLYSRNDLTSAQKDAVALASDCKRIESRLEQLVISAQGNASAEQAVKVLVQQRYEFLRASYVSCTLRTENFN